MYGIALVCMPQNCVVKQTKLIDVSWYVHDFSQLVEDPLRTKLAIKQR